MKGRRKARSVAHRESSPLPIPRSLRRTSGGGGASLRYPLHLAAVVLEALGTLEGILVRVHDQVPFIVIFVRNLDSIDGNGDILFAHPKKAADADDERCHLAVAIDKHILDLADLAVVGIIDALLVPMSDGLAVGRDARHYLSSRAAASLLGLRARACRNERDDDRSIGKSRHEGISFGAGCENSSCTQTWLARRSSGGGLCAKPDISWRVAASSSGSPARQERVLQLRISHA